MNQMRHMKRDIEVALTEQEIVAKAQELSHLHAEAAEIAKELADFTKEKKAEIKTRTDRISQICRVIEHGVEVKTMEVEAYSNYERNTVQYFHEGKVVDERGMDDSDRQETMFNAGVQSPVVDPAEEVFADQFPTE